MYVCRVREVGSPNPLPRTEVPRTWTAPKWRQGSLELLGPWPHGTAPHVLGKDTGSGEPEEETGGE